jgi:hypothetical protein
LSRVVDRDFPVGKADRESFSVLPQPYWVPALSPPNAAGNVLSLLCPQFDSRSTDHTVVLSTPRAVTLFGSVADPAFSMPSNKVRISCSPLAPAVLPARWGDATFLRDAYRGFDMALERRDSLRRLNSDASRNMNVSNFGEDVAETTMNHELGHRQ